MTMCLGVNFCLTLDHRVRTVRETFCLKEENRYVLSLDDRVHVKGLLAHLKTKYTQIGGR
jgi:hypothetical protein